MNKIKIRRRDVNKGDMISDLAGNRVVLPEVNDLYLLQEFLMENPTLRLGKSNRGVKSMIEYISTKDRYIEPKQRGEKEFKSLTSIIEVTTKGKTNIWENQKVDRMQNLENELRKGALSHSQMEKNESNVPRSVRDLYWHYRNIVEEIFGRDKVFIPI